MCRGAESCEVRAHLDLLLHERIRALCLPLHDSTTQRTASSYVYQSFSFLCFRPFLSLFRLPPFSPFFFLFSFLSLFFTFSLFLSLIDRTSVLESVFADINASALSTREQCLIFCEKIVSISLLL